MDAPESPGTQKVVGILSRGEDTDGETSDIDVDYPSESFVSQIDDEGTESDAQAAELEVTGEGTAGGPFGLKKVLFVRKKSGDKTMFAGTKEEPKDANKPQETFKDRVSKLGTGVTERFAALGVMMQDHGKAGMAGAKMDKTDEDPQKAEDGASSSTNQPPTPSSDGRPVKPKQPMDYLQEYELTFTKKPTFFVVPGPDGKGVMVAWPDAGALDASTSESSPPPGTPSSESPQEPAAGAIILSVGGESVVDAEPAHVMGLLSEGGGNGFDNSGTDDSSPAVTDGEESETAADEAGAKVKDTGFSLVIRFRDRTTSRQDGWQGTPGGEFFRNRVKAMATGFGNLFKEAGGIAVRDGSDIPDSPSASGAAASPALPSDMFVLTFSVEGDSAEGLPFNLAEMVGGRGVVVSSVRAGYEESLVRPTEAGVSAAGTPAIPEGFSRDGKVDGHEGFAPGAMLLRVAGQLAEGKSLVYVEGLLRMAAAEHSAVKILFRHAPPIYRASVAAELAVEVAKVPQIHVGTWQPALKRRAGVTLGGGDGEGIGGSVIGIGYGGEEWEDVRETMARAHQFVNNFRSCGIRVEIINMQTISIPRNVKSAYAGVFEVRPNSLQQAVRLWFSFPDERTISLKRDSSGLLGLSPMETRPSGTLGSWVTVTAVEGSPCAEAGIPVGENSILTHVNGYDVSPPAYRSLAPLPFGGGEGWAAAVLPVLEGGERGDLITLTIV